MKNVLTNLFNSSLFRHAQRLAIVCVLLSYAASASAWSEDYYAKIKVTVSGEGKVYAKGPKDDTFKDLAADGTYTLHDDDSGGSGSAPTTKVISYQLQAEPTSEAYYFANWSGDVTGETNPITATITGGTSGTPAVSKNITAVFKKKYVYRNYAKVVAIHVNEAGVPVFTGDITNPASIAFTQGGGYVNIGAEATNQTEVEKGDSITVAYLAAKVSTWNYTYYATPAENYAFAGWYDEATLIKQMKENGGKLLLDQPTDAEGYLKSFPSNCTDPNAADIPVAPTMYAVFRPSLTYYHSGPKVYVSNNEPEGGVVYVHSTRAADKPASVDAVATANWKKSHDDNATTYTQKDTATYSYTYYAKPSDPTKYAFKGWATSQFSDPTYGTDPIDPMFDYDLTMSAENTKPENRYITPPLFAVFESFYYKVPPAALATASQGAGYVYVDLTGSGMPSGYTGTEVTAGALNQVAANRVQHNYTVHYYAAPIPGNVFVGWSTTADGLNIINQKAHYEAEYASQAKNRDYPHVAAPLYAVFRSDIDIRQQDRMIVYIDEEGNGNINDSKVLIDFQKANTLTATLSGTDASLFSLSNRSGSKSGNSITFDATQGLIELVVAYKGDLATAVGKVANITLSAIYGEPKDTITRPVTIVVEEAPIITFLPTDGKGAYTIKMTNGSGINYTMDAATKENIKVPITHESMSNIEMALTNDVSSDNYYFFGWQLIDGNDMTYMSYEQLCTYQFTKPVKVRAEFIPKDRATYYIKNDPTNTLYHDLQKALDDANVLYNKNQVAQTVVLKDYQGATRVTEATLPKGTYTIHKNITLLIPGDAAHTSKDKLEPADYDSGKKTAAHYMKWIVEDGTNITVNGNVSIYSRLNANGQTWVGRPWQYGWVELGENCKLTFESGANLYAFGYITGPLTSSVTMKSGSKVKEAFQLLDWHGGTETMNYLKIGLGALSGQLAADEKVFPASQYYIQNVEVPMTLEYGASEDLSAGVDMGDLTVVETPFIATNKGFFRMVDGISLTKHYDKYTDTQVYTVNGNGTAEAKLGNIELEVNVSILTGTLKSEQFVLPMPHNMDIRLNNARLNVLYDLAFLAGSKLSVDKNSRFIVNGTSSQSARVFIYDRSENGPHYSISNKELVPVGARPGGILYERTPEYLEDASWVVDGVVETGQYGYLYTTASGANITSNGGGKIKYAKIGTETKTYQRPYQVGFIPIPVTAAKMRNSDGTYVQSEATTFTYKQGQWMKEDSEGTYKEPILVDYTPKFNVENKTLTAYVGKSDTLTLGVSTNNNNLNWSDDVTWSYVRTGTNADQFTVTGTLPNANVVFTPRSEGTKTATLLITAHYERTIHNQKLTYVYTKAVYLTGNASYLAANTLAFEDLSTLYKGQSGVALFTTSNNTQPITITANPASAVTITGNTAAATIAGENIGKVTITATQPADLTYNIAATTITKTIEVNDPVQWNWDVLYLGEQYDTPITMLDSTTGWTLTEAKDEFNIINFQGTAPNYTASVANLIAGSFKIDFTFTQNGKSRPFTSHVIVDPRHLRVDVNNDTVFRAVTLSANEAVNFIEGQNGADGQIVFTSTESSISQWKLGFFGVPDKIYFQAAGANTWQIEESSNGTNWTTSFPWKSIAAKTDFEHSLLPSTRFLRISYGAGKTAPASLKELYITELTDVKANVEKLYIPVQKDAAGNPIPYTKEVVFTYANTGELGIGTTNFNFFQLKESTSTGEAGDVVKIEATTEQNPFGIMGIEVISTATEEMEGYLEVYEGNNNTPVLQIPIQTYLFPQELPIKLATDKPDGGDRYYYVTTHTHNAEWDGRDGVRTITLNNAVSDAAPYLTFEYSGNPTYIGFNHAVSAKGTWELEQFINGNWAFVSHNPAKDVMDPATGTFKRFVDPNASKLRVIYQSEYAEKVDITDLVIVGDASAIVDPARMELDYDVAEDLNVLAINLPNLKVKSTNANFKVAYVKDGAASEFLEEHSLTSTNFAVLNGSDMDTIPFQVIWSGTEAIENGTLELTATIDGEEKLLATVELVGVKQDIANGDLGIYTGVAAGYTLAGKYKADGVTLTGKWQGDTHRPVNIAAAFDPDSAALFDYVVVYGETTTSDGSKTINQPNTLIGSNAKTPCYIYKKNGTKYQFYKSVENANSKEKAWNETLQEDMDAVQIPDGQTAVSMYITGFCPYASTGYTKGDEGVWYFRANAGDSINVYLQDCYIYSRAKTHDGHSFVDRQDGNSFSSGYSCGSGAVLVFVCNEKDNMDNAMNVTIHTLDSSLLKSNYGCFLQSAAGRAFQVSPAIQIRLINDQYYQTTTTVLNFTDEWPASQHAKTGAGVRTNGFLSLQKQHNNAPSIDMGNERTVVNFNGGQVELQNAQIVSTNYISSMAICHRTGKFAGIPLAYGLGTDGVGGTVNFNDGTTTVLPMEVDPNYRQYYLMDTDANGNELTTTSCLRTPQNTFVTGGSHCMMRACSSPTSKGGAPKDKAGNDGKLLGLYKFPKNPEAGKKGGWTEGENGLVDVVTSDEDPVDHQVPVGYNVKSVTPNNNGTKDNKEDDFLNFWFDPDFEPSAKPEIDMPSSFWKTCMTEIEAQYGGYGNEEPVGGDATIYMQNGKQHEEVVNLMYCKIDEYIHTEISDSSYAAPVKNPAHVGEKYLPVKPSFVGAEIEHYITNEQSFQVKNKVYYITTATADVWNAFTAPFDVKKVYIMETYPEQLLQDMEGTVVGEDTLNRIDIIKEQAKHNADFAAFFAVTVALGQQKDFETIYREYIDWAKIQDKASGVWDGKGTYTLRGKSALVPYNGSNWKDADFYLNENVGVWEWNNMDSLWNGYFTTTWQFPNASDTILMHQGRTYSMLLPFCTKCGNDINSREYWDYWSGKFLIFESTAGPHIINGSNVLDESNGEGIFATMPNEGEALLKGNSTFAKMETLNNELFTFTGDLQHSTFYAIQFDYDELTGDIPKTIAPTESFLMPNISSVLPIGARLRGVTTSGQAIFDVDNSGDGTTTDVHRPTIGGGNSLFITETANGINIAVAEPQHVRVLSSTGVLLYNGMVQNAVDVTLPTAGVYVVAGENEVQKILF